MKPCLKNKCVISIVCMCLLGALSVAQASQESEQKTVFHAESGEDKNQVIELFTSEGCSSCPPADRYLSEYMNHEKLWHDIVPLAFHVDYWDYIGWKDRFASAEYSNRQRYYGRIGNTKSVYTPQFVVDGKEWRGFFRRWLGAEVPEVTGQAGNLSLHIENNDRLAAKFDQLGANQKDLVLHVALLASDIHSEVDSGENHGKKLEHDFVVLAHHAYAQDKTTERPTWQGRVPEMPAIAKEAGRLAWAAWVTDRKGREPIQATGGWIQNN